MAEHPKIGQVVLEQAGALRDAATIVLHHHEWYDGRGYPHGLAGGEIPIGARIVSIVDAYEAMIAGRPYRTAISHEEAIAELRRQAGVQFDPELVEVFARVFAAGVPWAPETHDHEHDHDHHDAGDTSPTRVRDPGGRSPVAGRARPARTDHCRAPRCRARTAAARGLNSGGQHRCGEAGRDRRSRGTRCRRTASPSTRQGCPERVLCPRCRPGWRAHQTIWTVEGLTGVPLAGTPAART